MTSIERMIRCNILDKIIEGGYRYFVGFLEEIN